MNFTAIDFETANGKRTSACSLGVAVVENLEIIETRYWLIRPEPFEFNYFNALMHGLTENILWDKPLFCEHWEEIKPYLEDKILVAHNAEFDISVLTRTLEFYDLPLPDLNYICTYKASQKVFNDTPNHQLRTLAESLNIQFEHHDALEDAKVAAKILIDMVNSLECSCIIEFANTLDLRLGTLSKSGHTSCAYTKSPPVVKTKRQPSSSSARKIIAATSEFDTSNELYGKIVVFTGALNGMGRQMAYQAVADLGGFPADNVTLKTDYLVLGAQDYRLLRGHKQSRKTRTAIKYANNGTGIQIISEEEFYKMIGERGNE